MQSRANRLENEAAAVADKPVPHNLEAEEATLGCLLIDRDAIIKVASFLRPEDFFSERNGVLYRVRLDLYDHQRPGDFVTICDELERRGQLEAVGGAAYVSSLVSAVPTAVHIEHYAHIVERTAIMRRLISAAGQIAALGYEDRADVTETLDEATQILYRVAERRLSQEFTPLSVALTRYFEQIDYIHQHKGEILGVPAGFADLDKLTGGFHPSDLIILAGRPAVGKTALALTVARNAAVRFHQPVAIFSLEMSTDQLVQRLLSSEANVDSQRLRNGYVDDYEWRRISEALGVLSEAPIYIDDTAGLSALELRTKARRLKSEADIRMIIVDYLQLMQGRGLDNRVQEVAEISRGLKVLARELSVPVIALSQLSRAIEHRQDHRPLLSDLRESGSIEQDADIVMFVHREELYNTATEKLARADIIIAKHRNGPIAEIPMRFFPNQTKFADLEVYRQADGEE
ncbi:MAG: replicative DNA helicase [Chloroflexi bacterium]|nr:replicative DNA helicase [Chloroflexota bacterium]